MSYEIKMQADDFFNAYRVLRESDEVMMGKLEKLSGKPLVSETAFGALPVSTPSVVCLAFALELYIKELYVVLKARDSNEEDVKLHNSMPSALRLDNSEEHVLSHYMFAEFQDGAIGGYYYNRPQEQFGYNGKGNQARPDWESDCS